jgi:hypothetical protein
MPREMHSHTTPLAEDFEAGDDSDLPGLDQPVTSDDIGAILNSARASSEAKRAELLRIRDDLIARSGMQESGEHDGLIADIDDALSMLDSAAQGAGGPEAYGFDPDDRVLQPDEIAERAEEARAEAERERG